MVPKMLFETILVILLILLVSQVQCCPPKPKCTTLWNGCVATCTDWAGCYIPTGLDPNVTMTPDDAIVTPGNYYPIDTVVTFDCATGMYLSAASSTSATCGCNGGAGKPGSWSISSTPVCLVGCYPVVQTAQIVSYSQGTTSAMHNLYPVTTKATFSCNNGFYLSNLLLNSSSTCSTSGYWSPTPPTCLSGCSPFTIPFNGSLNYNPNTVVHGVQIQGDKAHFNCTAGYYLSPSVPTRTCLATGWDNSIQPICYVGCSNITNFPNGEIWYPPSSTSNEVHVQGTVIYFNCTAGYYLDSLPATDVTDCTNAGQWRNIPSCLKGCDPMDAAIHFPFTALRTFIPAVPQSNGVYRAGESVIFTCNPTYYLDPATNSTCQVDGTWANVPACLPGCTEILFVNISVSTPNITYNSNYVMTGLYGVNTIASFACSNGYYLGSRASGKCVDGNWTDLPICLPGCPAPPIIDRLDRINYTPFPNLTQIPSLYANASIAQYVCTFDSLISDVSTMNCINGNWTEPTPVCKQNVVLVVVKILMSLSCSFLVISLGVIVIINFIVRDFSIETCLHLSEEIFLFIAHVLVLCFRDRTDLTDICPIVCAILQYLFTASFFFMVLESFQSYYILNNVISFGGLCWAPKIHNLVVGSICPLIPTGITIALKYHEYISKHSCWVNMGSEVSLYILGPIFLLFLITIIMTEAAAMVSCPPLPLVDKQQLVAAHVNQKGMAPLCILSLLSWFFGMLAAYQADAALYSIAASLNIAFGVIIIIFHFVGNPKLNNYFHQKILKKCCKKEPEDKVKAV